MRINRRDFLKAGLAGAVLPVVGTAQQAMTQEEAPTARGGRRPNVIFILADDLGYQELGCYGQRKIRTPNLDRLAAEGMRFTQHYCGQAVCAPSRCALMTGKHMGHAYIRDNRELAGGYQLPIPDETLTLAEIFQRQGYATGCFGKWGLGGPDTEGHPNRQGFDAFFGNLGQVQAHWHYHPYVWHNDEKIDLPGNHGDTGDRYTHDLMAQHALRFIRDHRDEPFFLYVPFLIPHVSLHVPDDSLAEYLDEGWPETPYQGPGYPRGYSPCDRPKATYAAMISRMDRDIGRILHLLKDLGLDEDTLVLFSSDNGTTYCCGVDHDFFDSVGPLRGLKGSLYEGGIRVPLIARWPGRIRPGTTTDHLSAFWDFVPTCCELIGAPTPDGTDGLSYLPTLLGRPDHQQRHDYLYWEFRSYGAQQAVRLGRWKGYRKNVHKDPKPPLELYDLRMDIGERTNVAAAHPDIVRRIEQIMAEAHTPSPQFPLLPGEG